MDIEKIAEELEKKFGYYTYVYENIIELNAGWHTTPRRANSAYVDVSSYIGKYYPKAMVKVYSMETRDNGKEYSYRLRISFPNTNDSKKIKDDLGDKVNKAKERLYNAYDDVAEAKDIINFALYESEKVLPDKLIVKINSLSDEILNKIIELRTIIKRVND